MEDQQRFIEIDGEQIAVTEQVYRAYKRPAWAEHKRKEREKRCRDENGNRCANDCKTCSKPREGGVLSLDQFAEAGYESPDPVDIDELVAEKLLLEQLYIALDELTQDERNLVDDLYFDDKSERNVADKLGLSQKGINKRKHKVIEKLRNLMTEE